MGECLDNARASGLFRALADLAGRPIKDMPFAFASPEWSNEKGVGAALGFRLLGVPSYHCVPAPIGGSAAVSRFFHETTQDSRWARRWSWSAIRSVWRSGSSRI
jgi:anaerobic carbon-monoxide dehydrogenase catalytic subunit